MARPPKQTVEYFPHYVSGKRTMRILEDRFGNDGYSFWFKLLELLGDTQGHAYDCNDSLNWEFLLTKTRVSDVSATEILELLVRLEAIDAQLWEHRIIWCQNFVNNLSGLYDKRTNPPPKRPAIPASLDNRSENPSYIEFPERKPTDNDQSTPKTPQTKVKESKVDVVGRNARESEDDSYDNEGEESSGNLLDGVSRFKARFDSPEPPADPVAASLYDPVFKDVVQAWKNCGFPSLTPNSAEGLGDLVEVHTAEWVIAALKRADELDKRNLAYITKMLDGWRADGGIMAKTRDAPPPDAQARSHRYFAD